MHSSPDIAIFRSAGGVPMLFVKRPGRFCRRPRRDRMPGLYVQPKQRSPRRAPVITLPAALATAILAVLVVVKDKTRR
jgi:hypothetical protein